MSRYTVVFLAIIAVLTTGGYTSPGFNLKRELADRDMASGNRAMDTHDYRRAVEAYSRVIDSNEVDGEDLARAYFRRAESRRALVFVTGPDDAALMEALNDNHEAIKLHDDEPGFFQSRARTYSFLGAYPEAFSDLKAAARLEKRKPSRSLIQKGALERTLGDHKAALDTLRSVLKMRGKGRSISPYYHLALTYADQGNYRDAVAVLNEGIEVEADYFRAWLERGCAKAKLGDYAGALADYRKGVELFEEMDHYKPPYPATKHDDRIHREELDLLRDVAEKRLDPDKERIGALCSRFWFRQFDKKRERSPLLPG